MITEIIERLKGLWYLIPVIVWSAVLGSFMTLVIIDHDCRDYGHYVTYEYILTCEAKK